MRIDLSDLAETTLAHATRHKVDAADVLIAKSEQVSVDVLNGELEKVHNSDQVTLGLRVIMDSRQACVSSSDFRPDALKEVVERAIAMAREAPRDPTVGLAEPDQLTDSVTPASLEVYDASDAPTLESMEAFGLALERAALAVEGVSRISSASVGCGSYRSILMATNGFVGERINNYRSAGCSAVVGEGLGMQTDYYAQQRVFETDMDSPEFIGRKAGERAARKLGSTKPETMSCPIIYDRRVAGSLIGHLLSAANGTAIARGSSWLMGLMGQQVLPTSLNLVEEPHRSRSLASKYFDAEGIATVRRNIVENGILKTWILDLGTARKLGLKTTGNAKRGFSSGPAPGMTNVALTPGNVSRDELIRKVKKGVLVKSLIGSTINPNTGDYSRGASGFLIEGGKITKPVTEFTIAGNLKTMLMSVVPANDKEEFRSYRIPSLLVENMTVAGV